MATKEEIVQAISELEAAVKPMVKDYYDRLFFAEFFSALEDTKAFPCIDYLEDLILVIPYETDDAPWWPTALQEAVKKAEALIETVTT